MTTMHAPFAVRRRLATPIGWHGSTRLLGALLLVAVVQGCNSTRVARIDPASVTDLSGRWNDADSRLVANALITQSLEGNWARQWAETHGGRTPTVIVGGFANRTMEHIPVGTFTRDLERAFVTSGAVRVVASAEERQSVRTERADQQTNAQADTRARLALEQGAQFMLQGDVQAIEDAQGRERAITYQIDATLVDLESNAKIWVGQHRIKKVIDRRRFGW
jgi:penicillin-binding protein activator